AKEEKSRAKGSKKDKSKGPAAVRIAMTVAERGVHEGELREVKAEVALDSDEPKIEFHDPAQGSINADLTVGTDVTSAVRLLSNAGICHDGVKLHGKGFAVTRNQFESLGFGRRDGIDAVFRPYRNGRDLTAVPFDGARDKFVIDLFGLGEREVRTMFPEVYQHLLATVKAERDTNRRESYRKFWWVFGEPRREMRPAMIDLSRYIATVDTARHRVFQFLDLEVLCDDKVVVIADDSADALGILQSQIHVEWAARVGGWLGVGNDSVYAKSKTFDPFPFPDASPEQRARIAELAEELDATRKAALAETGKLTMTELYNLREKLRSGAEMDDKEQRRATKARAAIVNRLHEQLDQAVADSYGWGEEWRAGTLGPSEIVARLVALNRERAAEEKAGKIRWLRPEYQQPRFGKK
ncbi:MAG TPA: type IIL restriction-modification enzyme MmeI, partial [Sphingomicrobium sp.]|nr:type IIL restriction-modification enzyme MmeI [Sphingomicrobium sp.]